jgi:predicted DNA-binding transcriptional regulator AlpA
MPDTIPLRPDSAPADHVEAPRDRPGADRPAPLTATLEPLLVGAREAGRLCGRSEASWWRDHAAAHCPRPVRLGGRTLWRVEDLRMWVELGCPSRSEFEARRRAR